MTEFHNLVRMMEAITVIHDLGDKYGLPKLAGTVAMRFDEVMEDPLSPVSNMTQADQKAFIEALNTYVSYARKATEEALPNDVA